MEWRRNEEIPRTKMDQELELKVQVHGPLKIQGPLEFPGRGPQQQRLRSKSQHRRVRPTSAISQRQWQRGPRFRSG